MCVKIYCLIMPAFLLLTTSSHSSESQVSAEGVLIQNLSFTSKVDNENNHTKVTITITRLAKEDEPPLRAEQFNVQLIRRDGGAQKAKSRVPERGELVAAGSKGMTSKIVYMFDGGKSEYASEDIEVTVTSVVKLRAHGSRAGGQLDQPGTERKEDK
jgi:hypothetical protein